MENKSDNKDEEKLFEQLLDAAEKRGDKLKLAQAFRLLKRLSLKLLFAIGGVILALCTVMFEIGVYYQEHQLAPTPPSALTETVLRNKPVGTPSIRIIPYKEQPDWNSDHLHWLEQEGDRDKQAGLIGTYGLGEAAYMVPSPSTAFDIVLRVSENYTIASNTAFRVSITSKAARALASEFAIPMTVLSDLR